MKRIFSNKSGFTLVEIVVAFAVFAIMASMIVTMVQLTMSARMSNEELATRTETQTAALARYYINDADKFVAGDSDGKFELTFSDKNCDVYMDYQIRGGLETNEAYGINYFVGDTTYNAGGGGSNNGNGGLGGGTGSVLGQSQASQVDTRLTGNKNLAYIHIRSIGEDESYTGEGVKYNISVSAQGKKKSSSGTVPDEEVPFLQYKLRFYSDDTYTKEIVEGKDTYIYTFHHPAPILDYGYTDPDGTNKYVVSKAGDHIITVTAPCSYDNPGYEFIDGNSDIVNFWVIFADDPGLDMASFGDNSTDSGTVSGAKVFTNNKYKTYSPNIFGAYIYPKVKKGS